MVFLTKMGRLVLLTTILLMPYQLPAATEEPVLSEDAAKIMARMTDFISAAPAFSLLADTGYEVVQKNGHVLEFGSQLTLAIQRPSKAIGRFDSRDGGSSTTVLDGEAIWVYIAKDNIYDTTSQPGDIDVSLDFLARQLGIPLQLRDFFSKDLTASLGSAVQSGYYVGESMISGVMCDHLALRGDKEDVQVWVAQGDEPVPRRIVITYRQIEGQPQFWIFHPSCLTLRSHSRHRGMLSAFVSFRIYPEGNQNERHPLIGIS